MGTIDVNELLIQALPLNSLFLGRWLAFWYGPWGEELLAKWETNYWSDLTIPE